MAKHLQRGCWDRLHTLRVGRIVRSAEKPQPSCAKRLECAELAPAFRPPPTMRQRQQAGRTPYASRGTPSIEALAAGDQL
jgi:hypothetical protein